MSLNQYMHPRNPFFQEKPNFEQLSREFPSLKQYLNEKNQIDFKNPHAIRELCCALLKSKFDLKLKIPIDSLIPRVPQRLNYILWIEDLLASKNDAHGIDIGCGSSCIFSLLACSLNKQWRMLTTEIDEINYEYARDNVKINNLEDRIIIQKVHKGTYLCGVVANENDQIYDFVMCNPPFYTNENEALGLENTRKPNERPRAKSINTAKACEALHDSGGEAEFVKRIIDESISIGKKVRIYTTMFGKKSSLLLMRKYLEKEKFIKNISETQFCQGNTMRWGLAWSFYDDKLPQFDYFKATKSKTYSFTIDKTSSIQPYNVKTIYEYIKNLMINDLKFEVINQNNKNYSYTFKAYENTWSYQRKKRRQRLVESKKNSAKEEPSEKKMKLDLSKALVECKLQIKPINGLIIVEMNDEIGQNKDMTHQIIQFIQNKIKN